jgi:peroxiredoxin
MLQAGETAPTFTASVATTEGELETFDLSAWFDDAPLVVAFFPAAFSSTCTDELASIQSDGDRFAGAGGTVLGVSTDLPWALREFADAEGLQFPLVADHDREGITAFDVVDSFPELGLERVAQRSVFVVDESRTITYAWAADHPGQEPPYEDVLAATRGAEH